MILVTEISRLFGAGGMTPFSKECELSFPTREAAKTFIKGKAYDYKDKANDVVEIDNDDVCFLSHYDGYDTTEKLYVITEVR